MLFVFLIILCSGTIGIFILKHTKKMKNLKEIEKERESDVSKYIMEDWFIISLINYLNWFFLINNYLFENDKYLKKIIYK